MTLSQNFLRRAAVAQRLVDVYGVGPDDTVVEVGPGSGMITRELANRASPVIAHEKDEKYVRLIQLKFAGNDHVTCVNVDFC
ncbi:rRNA adenine N-6-methyltransferase family protein [Micromonospora zamorensis]|uniref:rRNA adenine N-6-methyltransferase family protein n=1 Tax=Micromonospora zamorensis TaxID=709883 RepID=UPI003D97F666